MSDNNDAPLALVTNEATNNSTVSIPQTDPQEAIRFLKWHRPEGPWHLAGFLPDGGKPKFKVFNLGQEEELCAWLEENNKTRNCYYTCNSLVNYSDSKPSESDVASMDFLQLDCDPRAGEDAMSERIRIREVFEKKMGKRPSALIFSGNGYQGFWRLASPVPVINDPDKREDCKLYNKKLAADSDGDKCHSLEHLFRLPGTTNWPDENKRERGCVPTLATITWLEDSTYDLSQFEKAQSVEKKKPKAGKRQSSGNLADKHFEDHQQSLADALEAWDRLPAAIDDLPERVMHIMLCGAPANQCNGSEPEAGVNRSAQCVSFAAQALREGVDPAKIAGALLNPEYRISDHCLKPGSDSERAAERAVGEAISKLDEDGHVFRGDYMETAKAFLDQSPDLIHTEDKFYTYHGPHYMETEPKTMRRWVREFLNGCVIEKDGVRVPLNPRRAMIAEVIEAVEDATLVPRNTLQSPCWIGDGPDSVLPVTNGLLDLDTGKLLDSTPKFFTTAKPMIKFDPAAKCPLWHEKLKEVLEADQRDLLQEIFGYLITRDTSEQKMFLLVGPMRGFKGTALRVIKGLVGEENYGVLDTDGIQKSDFALQPLIGKTIAAVPDMRLDRRSGPALVKSLLNISGEDDVAVNRKYATHWSGRLNVRVIIGTNDVPEFSESSAALANRLVTVVFTKSFIGQEDKELTDKLMKELSGILNWAMVGLKRLREEGRFTMTKAAKKAVVEIHKAGNPIVEFAEEYCTLGADQKVVKSDLRYAVNAWLVAQGRLPLDETWLSKHLFGAFPHLKAPSDNYRIKVDERRVRGYRGIGLNPPPKRTF